ncbi:MAG: hypothetical protein F4Z00_12785 [Acidimicrobiaceae bacterium]|nr:hypothetical protein [Acidimicrobiaceae bacterium]MXZ66400.1 hypothetical protein [Acidimicrobiaceae bacterium]MYF34346.1 hypothetical protein [Acidimicrobiaceae bacterium]MYG78911.1 hypothetical protein [Acidimicrobiaceae bacterium]MYJ83529.1 hypothetical protein [Acidimicrobiaceae bacterium]
MVEPVCSTPEQAWRYLRLIRRSDEAKRLCDWLDEHTGPMSRCSGEVLLLAMFLAAEIKSSYLRSQLCAVINGLDATILFDIGLCDPKQFTPVSYSSVVRQVRRLETAPFTELMEAALGKGAAPNHGPGADAGLLWFNQGLLLGSVPKQVLTRIKVGAVDATAFATNARVTDFRRQADVDKMLRDSLINSTPLPDGLIVGQDGKIQRCKADPEARTSVRGASRATGHKQSYFTGYFGTIVAASPDRRDYPDPNKDIPPERDIGPYVLSFSLDPATVNRAPVGRDVVLSLKKALPRLDLIVADREFTTRSDFVRPLHEADIDIIMDYTVTTKERPTIVRVGRRREPLYLSCGDFFPLWMPERFLVPPDPSFSSQETADWAEDRAKYRYVRNGKSKGGTIQFRCPQCAGNVIGAANTRTGPFRKGKRRHLKGIPALGPPFPVQWCCNGTINIRADELDQWQPESWATEMHRRIYGAGRSRIENANGIVKHEGGMDPRACEASGVRPHSMALLALAVANNVTRADADVCADPPTDDVPEAEPSLFCVTSALHSNGSGNGTGNGTGTGTGNGSAPDTNTGTGNGSAPDTNTGAEKVPALRAPP